MVDQPVSSQQEAKTLAISLLRERAYSYVTGTGQAIGIPDLRPGDNVEWCKDWESASAGPILRH